MLFGAVTTRRAGVVFALISLGVGELVFAAMRMLQGFSGGEEGITANRGVAPHPFGLTFGLAASGLLRDRVLGARRGARSWLRSRARPSGACAMRCATIPERAAFIGYDPRARALHRRSAVAAMFAGLAGGLHAVNYEIVAAECGQAQRAPARCC